MRPKVTIVMPVYNRERFVGAAIESVLAQTFGDFELIVVDDGSTDATPERVRACNDRRLRYIWRQHGGISAAMNTGMSIGRGLYFARLDSDDVWLPDLLETQVAILDTRPNVGVAYARAQGMEKDGRLTNHIWGVAPRYPDDPFRSMLHGDFTCNITVVARRECIEQAGLYDETMTTNEDWDLWLRVARHCSFVFTDRVLARFRWHEGNITSPNSPLFRETLERRVSVLDKVFSDPSLSDSIRALKPRAYSNAYVSAGLLWLGIRNYREAGRAFWRACRTAPNAVAALVRIAWFIVNWEYLSRRAWGRQLVDWQSRTRANWRRRRASMSRN